MFQEANSSTVGPFTATARLVRVNEKPHSLGEPSADTRPTVAEATGQVRRDEFVARRGAMPHRDRTSHLLYAYILCDPPSMRNKRANLVSCIAQASTKKTARQLAAAAVIELLLQSTPPEAFFCPIQGTSTGKLIFEADLALALGAAMGAADVTAVVTKLAMGCRTALRHLQAGSQAGIVMCTPAMALYRYALRVSSRRLLVDLTHSVPGLGRPHGVAQHVQPTDGDAARLAVPMIVPLGMSRVYGPAHHRSSARQHAVAVLAHHQSI
jgi:hypothetical protein